MYFVLKRFIAQVKNGLLVSQFQAELLVLLLFHDQSGTGRNHPIEDRIIFITALIQYFLKITYVRVVVRPLVKLSCSAVLQHSSQSTRNSLTNLLYFCLGYLSQKLIQGLVKGQLQLFGQILIELYGLLLSLGLLIRGMSFPEDRLIKIFRPRQGTFKEKDQHVDDGLNIVSSRPSISLQAINRQELVDLPPANGLLLLDMFALLDIEIAVYEIIEEQLRTFLANTKLDAGGFQISMGESLIMEGMHHFYQTYADHAYSLNGEPVSLFVKQFLQSFPESFYDEDSSARSLFPSSP